MTAIPPRRTFRAADKLLTPADFKRIYNGGRSASDGTLVVYVRANDMERTRLGLSVSRQVGNAVTRNRWKRHLREAFRLNREQLPTGLDVVVIPRRQPMAFEKVAAALVALVERARRKLPRETT
jgi:ribonuclease P protein component